ncbi:MAG: phosphoribosylformylglycinamidine synthase I [Chloroflexota bacterium]
MAAEKRVLILHAPGTNRDGDLAAAFQLAGGKPEIIPLSELAKLDRLGDDFGLLALPGGFSYGDALGAGQLWAIELQTRFSEVVKQFVESGRPVVGICNGFQALVKADLLPGNGHRATLTYNQSAKFECRWVTLTLNQNNPSGWLKGIERIVCPVAHGEGRFLLEDNLTLSDSQIALKYSYSDGSSADMVYPENPNGSPSGIAGITNPAGNILGLMPHPEDHIMFYQNPSWTRNKNEKGKYLGLSLFKNGLAMI